MAHKITIKEYACLKESSIIDIVDYARGKGISIPDDPAYLLDDSVLKQIDPVFYHNLKYRQIKPDPNTSSGSKVVGKISLDALKTSNTPIGNASS